MFDPKLEGQKLQKKFNLRKPEKCSIKIKRRKQTQHSQGDSVHFEKTPVLVQHLPSKAAPTPSMTALKQVEFNVSLAVPKKINPRGTKPIREQSCSRLAK